MAGGLLVIGAVLTFLYKSPVKEAVILHVKTEQESSELIQERA